MRFNFFWFCMGLCLGLIWDNLALGLLFGLVMGWMFSSDD